MMDNMVSLDLLKRKNNPRNSEGSFVTLNDGRILFAYSRFTGKSGSDFGKADLAARYSSDGGITWTQKDKILLRNKGAVNVMSVSLLRLQDGRIAMSYVKKEDGGDCRPHIVFSEDEGMHWSKPVCCISMPGYFVLNNDRLIQLKNRRLVLPLAYHRPKDGGWHPFDLKAITVFYYSDDGGCTWHESNDWWSLPVRSGSGLQEPGAVELKDGRLLAWARTDTGWQWEMTSRDRGVTWSPPEKSKIFRSPNAPLSIKRIPQTGDLLAVWCDHSPRWGCSHMSGKSKTNEDISASRGRTPLAMAISRDEGKTWRYRKCIETDLKEGFCYIAIHFAEDAALLGYMHGHKAVLANLRIRRLSLDWLYAKD